MDAAAVRRAAGKALDAAGLTRQGRSRWHLTTPDLDWFVHLDRGASYSSWSAQFGVVVRSWPDEGMEHLRQDYTAHRGGVPPSAAQYRWDDHVSYFTAAFDHKYDGPAALPDEERLVAFDFMAAELDQLFRSHATLPSLVEAVAQQQVSGFVHRRLREAARR